NIPAWAKAHVTMLPDPTPYLTGAALVLAVGWAYHELRMRLPEYVSPDVSAREAFRHLMLDSKWALGRNPDDSGFYHDIERELKDAARLGKLKVWARLMPRMRGGYPKALEEIDPSRWNDMDFDLVTCMGGSDSATITDHSTTNWIYYEDTQLNQAQILVNWPKANWFQKHQDRLYKERKRFYSNEAHVTDDVSRQAPKP
ncbi:MAG: hypothetical protein ACREB6_06260, partial [Rhodospirillales bacterium]